MSKQLFSIDSNAKTVKGQKYGFLTGVMYLAPHTLSGINLCPMADIAKCAQACLNTAGRGAFTKIQNQRIAKTRRFIDNRDAFMADIVWSIQALIRKANRMELTPLVRLNGTSDIRWENIPVTVDGIEYRNAMAAFPGVQFYDYTKIANRKNIPANYDLTFSYSGVAGYQAYAQKAIANGMRVAVVFRTREEIPATFLGMQCVDGDNSDIRHLDDQGVCVALYAKGPAKRDTTGFVIDARDAANVRKVFEIRAISFA